MSFRRCPLAFSPSSRSRRPNGQFARPAGYFSSAQMDLIEGLSVTIGEPDFWGFTINPLWAAHLTHVEKAWDHAAESR